MSLSQHFAQMARNNAWSNGRLYAAGLTLDHAALTAPRVSFFPSLFATLRHLWIVDEYYVDGLEGRGRGYAIFKDEMAPATLPELWRAQRAVDDRLIAFCDAQTSDEALLSKVTLDRPKGPQTDTRSDILAHLFVHQIHHRGQVHAMLAGTTVAPPPLDEWFLALDRPIAERELAALKPRGD